MSDAHTNTETLRRLLEDLDIMGKHTGAGQDATCPICAVVATGKDTLAALECAVRAATHEREAYKSALEMIAAGFGHAPSIAGVAIAEGERDALAVASPHDRNT